MKVLVIAVSIILLTHLSSIAQTSKNQDTGNGVLYNGIKLPSEWPPRYKLPVIRKEMIIPYLTNVPKIIPVNIGRQLFVDSFLINKTENIQFVYHQPNFYPGNPVLQPDKKWEYTFEGSPYAAPFSDGIWYDEKSVKFKMWYLAGAGSIHKEKQSFYTCYAESKDGKVWVKVNQDIVEGTNIVDTSNRDASTVWLDKTEKNPAKRYKFFNVEKDPVGKRWQYVLKYSPDGIHWSEGVAQSGSIGDRSTAFYNPFTKKWVLSMRFGTSVSSRSRSYLENSDPEQAVSLVHRIRKDIKDRNIVFWFTPDDKEPRHPKFPEVDPGIYNFDAIAYESIMLGFYSVWQGPENNIAGELGIQKRNEVLLGYSRDGFHFYRPTHKPFMGVNETKGAWNWGNMQSVNGVPIIVGDSLYFYSSGRRLNDIMWDGFTSTGLATLRRDGFVSLKAASSGFIETRNLKFDGKYFFVNADIKGSLKVEILDSEGKVIKGFSKEDCITMNNNSTKQKITWKNKENLSSLIGKTVRFKFYLTQGDLYSFWVSPWESGESRGYTSGGGPDLSPTGKDIKLNKTSR
jgi:hypothetical protein